MSGPPKNSEDQSVYLTRKDFDTLLKDITKTVTGEVADQFRQILATHQQAGPSGPIIPTPAIAAPHDHGKRVVEDYDDRDEHNIVEGSRPQQTMYLSAPPKVPAEPAYTEDLVSRVRAEVIKEVRVEICTNRFDVHSLNIIPGIQLPENFKTPKFTLFHENSDLRDHLSMYCRKMTPYCHDEAMMIYLFQESLAGPATKWFSSLEKSVLSSWENLAAAFDAHYEFNKQLTFNKDDLVKMEKKSSETMEDYMYRWRTVAAQIHPPMTEEEMGNEFWKTLSTEYRGRLAVCVGYSFFRMSEAIERMEGEAKLARANAGNQEKKSHFHKKKDHSVNAVSAQPNYQYRSRNNFNPATPYNPVPLAQPNYYQMPPVQPAYQQPTIVPYQ